MVSKRAGQKGFTLVEAAIALVIASIMIGGALQGMQMVQNQRITSTLTRVNQIQAATQHFRDTYKGLPGDLSDGHTRINGCSAACENNAPGAGDGFVGAPAWDLATFQSASIANAANTTNAGETVLFWFELGKAGLMPGITSDGVTGVAATFGRALPAAPLGGGFLVGNSDGLQAGTAQGRPAGAGVYSMAGTVLALAPRPATLTSTARAQIISPSLAQIMDKKMDDGLPNSGTVQAYGATAGCYGAAAPYAYSSSGNSDCGLYFRIDEPQPVNGVCGTDNGTRVTAVPTTNRCTTGTPSTVTTCPSPELAWSCAGQNRGINTACAATLAAGTITAVTGTVTVTPTGGVATAVTAPASVYQSDTIQTAAASSAAIIFADNSALSLGDNSIMTVDQYSYDTACLPQQRSFFSLLQGVFVYTSGLIGVSDVSAVNINTPVGSIGIRGTRFGVNLPLSTFVVFSGSIVLTNSAGTRQGSGLYNALTATSYQVKPVLSGFLTQTEVNARFSSISESIGTGIVYQSGNITFAPEPYPIYTYYPGGTPPICAPGYTLTCPYNHDNSQTCHCAPP